MTYYDTLDEDLARARRIIATGLTGGDTYAAVQLLESFVDVLDSVRGRALAAAHQALMAEARQAVALGAGHDCGEWLDAVDRCRLCDRIVMRDAPP